MSGPGSADHSFCVTKSVDRLLPIEWLVWLNLFNAEFSPKRYWRGPRSQELGEEGANDYSLHATTRMTPALKMVSDESHFNVSLSVKSKVTKTVFINHNP